MKQSITLPSISSILKNSTDNDDDDFSEPHIMKLPALLNQCHHHHQHDKYNNGIFLPTSPVSLSSSSPIQQYDNNHHPFTTNAPPSSLIPVASDSRLSSLLPHNIKETSITENSDSPPLTHPSLFPIIFAAPLKFPSPSYKSDDKAKKPFTSSFTKIATVQQLQIIQSSASDGTIKKRRRGRPPVYTEYHCQQGSGTIDNHNHQKCTFLTPTAWDIPPLSTSKPAASPSCAMTTFSSITLEPELPPPRKKRGRNPKQSIQGNSCFLWKDIPIVRRKKIRPLLGQE